MVADPGKAPSVYPASGMGNTEGQGASAATSEVTGSDKRKKRESSAGPANGLDNNGGPGTSAVTPGVADKFLKLEETISAVPTNDRDHNGREGCLAHLKRKRPSNAGPHFVCHLGCSHEIARIGSWKGVLGWPPQ